MNLTLKQPLNHPLKKLKTAYQNHPILSYRIHIGWFGGIRIYHH